MTYNRLLTPRFYIDNCNWQASKGLSRNSMITIDADEVQLNAGYTKYQLFDMNPQNYATFNTSGGTGTTVLIAIDLGVSGISTNSIAIMNHNLSVAGGSLTVKHHTSPITAPTGVGTAVASMASVINGGSPSAGTTTPNSSGDTLLTFTASTDRYWSVQFDDVATWTGTDLQIGEIFLSKYFTMPHSPDLPTQRSYGFEGVSVSKSYGGKTFGSASFTGATSGDYIAFRSVSAGETAIGGREIHDYSTTYLPDTAIFPSDMSSPYSSSNFLGDVANKTSLQLITFIYTGDSTSTTKGDYLYARFEQATLTTSMPSSRAVSFSARIVQEF